MLIDFVTWSPNISPVSHKKLQPVQSMTAQLITKLLTHILIHLYQLWNLVPFSASLPVPPLVLLSLNYLVGKMVLASSGRVWVEAGCPSAGVLFNIKRNSKKRFKYAVRRLKCRKEFLIREKFACAFAARKKDKFWSEVRRLNHVKKSCAPSVDGTSNAQHIADLFSSRFSGVLNKHSSPSYDIPYF